MEMGNILFDRNYWSEPVFVIQKCDVGYIRIHVENVG